LIKDETIMPAVEYVPWQMTAKEHEEVCSSRKGLLIMDLTTDSAAVNKLASMSAPGHFMPDRSVPNDVG
jgi:hypothetical protein